MNHRLWRAMRWATVALVLVLFASACAGANRPSLQSTSAVASLPVTPAADESATAEDEGGVSPESGSAEAPTVAPKPTLPPLSIAPNFVGEPSARGLDAGTIRLGVVGTARFFDGLGQGVQARVDRANREGGIGGRQIDLVRSLDDGGDPAATIDALRRLVEDDEVFAVVLASGVVGQGAVDYLNRHQVPYFGWGFSAAFCDPNWWGFGFNGCLNGHALGIPGAEVDVALREMLHTHLGQVEIRAVLVTTGDDAGRAATRQAQAVWGSELVGTVRLLDHVSEIDGETDAVVSEVLAMTPDAVVLVASMEQLAVLKRALLDAGVPVVVDESTYLPGLLQDFGLAAAIEGGWALSQFPPQEGYRAAAAQLGLDLEAMGASPFFSRGAAVGYWSADLFVGLVDAVPGELNNQSFYETMNRVGVVYESQVDGALCPVNTLTIHRNPSGGAALVQVVDGIYQVDLPFLCWSPEAPSGE